MLKSASLSSQLPVPTYPARPSRRTAHRLVYSILGITLGFIAILAVSLIYELRTSTLQSHFLPQYAATLSYALAPGPSANIVFPPPGPFDDRRGYSRIPEFQTRLEAQGYEVVEQARVTPELARLITWGVNPPYAEAPTAGLTVRAAGGVPIHEAVNDDRQFRSFEEIPPLVTDTLLFIENRELLEPPDPHANPAIEWDRLAKASLMYTGSKLGLSLPALGGSTLAVQLEKYRHSPGGRTNSLGDKVRQVASASLKAYRDGSDTRSWRREIVVDYFNTLPLSAALGYGEIYGLGDGLHAWFGLNLLEVCSQLSVPESSPAKVSAYKHVLALLVALRAPSFYLVRNRDALIDKANEYATYLAQAGVIDEDFAEAVAAAPVTFLPRAPRPPGGSSSPRKSYTTTRTALLRSLGIGSFYDLDRLHLEVTSTIDWSLQSEVEHVFAQLGEPAFVRANGLIGKHLLRGADPANVIYSLMLFEETPKGNVLRVHADNLERPLDVNDGVKLDLGSTAKLRTLAHYLELVESLHRELSQLDAAELQARADTGPDPITAWAIETMQKEPGIDVETFLDRALDRKYTANIWEPFYTGGGLHYFRNFDKSDNRRKLTVRQALRSSTNLVFIRLMRDLVRYHRERLEYDADAVVDDPNHPLRAQMLHNIASDETLAILQRSYQRFHGLDASTIADRILGSRARLPKQEALLFYAWYPGASADALGAWFHLRGVQPITADHLARLVRAYGTRRFTQSDYAYLLSRHVLDVWSAREFVRDPTLSWEALLERSQSERGIVESWLLSPRSHRAQAARLRTGVERDAFARMTPYWRRLGFPFEHLVPTLATAIGNSSDRPAALAELMGIIANDGVRRPSLRLSRFHWGAGTPYETVMVPQPQDGERVMEVAVARALRGALEGVVQGGTAKRVAGAFHTRNGGRVHVGGKTGSGDNRFKTFDRRGWVRSSRAVNRTATFTFYIGDRYYGVLTAFVPGRQADRYEFTSALPVTVLKLLAPYINARLDAPFQDDAERRWADVQPVPQLQPVKDEVLRPEAATLSQHAAPPEPHQG